MPNITTTGTKDKGVAGFEFLERATVNDGIVLLFAGTTLPTTLTVGYVDDTGTSQVLEYGAVTSLPASMAIEPLNTDLEIVVTGGSPNFNVTHAGDHKNT